MSAIKRPTTETVKAISEIYFQGNVIPHAWYRHVRFENGTIDSIGILILAEIIYWYRPSEVKDERSGMLVGYQRKFKADKLQRSYQSLAKQFGISRKQVQDAIKRLVDLGLIAKETRTVETETGLMGNVLFVEPVPDAIRRITADLNEVDPPYTLEGISSSSEEEHPSCPTGDNPHALQGMTYTETTTEISTENTKGGSDFSKLADDISNIATPLTRGEQGHNSYSGACGVGTPENTAHTITSAHLQEARDLMGRTTKEALGTRYTIGKRGFENDRLKEWLEINGWQMFVCAMENLKTLAGEERKIWMPTANAFIGALDTLANIERARQLFSIEKKEGAIKGAYTAQERHSMIAMLIAKPTEFESLPDGKFRLLLTAEQYRERQAESKRKQEALKKGVAVEG
ncbi:MAG: helix-turn-helix domain-containing protein [Bacteroidetes bacterium]|nr:helix-turn-helix domain-containing protein [Bacteroidota bacterium]